MVRLLLLLVLAGFPACSATLQGSVQDSRGAAAAGATIHLMLQAVEKQTVRADAKGRYRLSSLPAGRYTLRAQLTSGDKIIVGPFVLGQTEVKTLDLVLKPSTASAEFFDEPKFTVAGVTDYTYVGGHGSDAVARSSDALAKATASLSREASAVSNDAASHHLLANAEEKAGKPLDAVREYRRAAELEASENNIFDWGSELLIHHAPEAAIEVFANGSKLYPSSSRMLLGAAAAYYSRSNYRQAATYFFQATDLNPADPGPYMFLGKVQSPEITETSGCLERLERFAKLQPDNAWASYYYAINLWKLRKNPEDTATLLHVQALLEKALRLQPGMSEAYFQLGLVLSEKQDVTGAIHAYQKAIEADPRMEAAHYQLSQNYRKLGETEKAQSELDTYQQLKKISEQQIDRERSELQRFVVTLKNP